MKKNFLFGCLVAGSLVFTSSLSAEKKVLAFSGSTRTNSYNKALIEQAADAVRKMGATVTVIDLKDYSMPFYDGDLEKTQGMPENAKRLRKLMIESDAIIIASPEYNGSISAVLKNTLDWASRSENGGASREAFEGKKFALMSASPGQGGGARGLAHLHQIIENVGGEVLKKNVKVKQAHLVINENGQLNNPAIMAEMRQELQLLIPTQMTKVDSK